jgi:hypothetical protein
MPTPLTGRKYLDMFAFGSVYTPTLEAVSRAQHEGVPNDAIVEELAFMLATAIDAVEDGGRGLRAAHTIIDNVLAIEASTLHYTEGSGGDA